MGTLYVNNLIPSTGSIVTVVGNARVTGNMEITGTLNAKLTDFVVSADSTTLGDAAGDTITINAGTVSIPNDIAFSGGDMMLTGSMFVSGSGITLTGPEAGSAVLTLRADQGDDVADTTTITVADGGNTTITPGSGHLILAGTTPKLTIGDAGAEDAMLAFDGNAQDFHIALDDTADDLVIGVGTAAGTTTAISINELAQVSVVDAFAANVGGAIGTLANDATPSVAAGNLWQTGGTTGITMFDDGIAGQTITVVSAHVVTYDVTGTNLKGGSTDIVTAVGDITTWTYDGSNWYLQQFMDVSDDMGRVAGDITGVTAGVGLSGGGSSGDVTLALDLSELSAVTPTATDSFATLDSDGSTEQRTTITDLATFMASEVTDGLSSSGGKLSLSFAAVAGMTNPMDSSDFFMVREGSSGTKAATTTLVGTWLAGTGLTSASGKLSVDAAQAITSVTADLTVAGGDLILGAGTTPGTVSAVQHATADTVGNSVTIEGGSALAGNTANTGAGGAVVIQGGAGKGTAAGGSIVFKSATAGGSGTALNSINDTILTLASDLSATFTGAVDIDGALTVDGAGVSIDSAGASANFTVASAGGGQDLTIGQTGGTDSSIIISSTGTGTDAVKIDTTAGSIDIDSADNITVDAADEISISTTSADGHITLASAHTAGLALHLSGSANAGSIVKVDAGILDIDVTAAATIDAVGVAIGAGSGELDLTTTGVMDINSAALDIDTSGAITIDAAGVASHIAIVTAHTSGLALHLSGSANAGSIVKVDAGILDLNVTAAATLDAVGIALGAGSGELDLTTTGTLDVNANILDMDLTDSSTITITSSEAAEDLTIEQVGANDSSIIIQAAGTGTDAIKLNASAGSIDIDASVAHDITINGGQILATAAHNVANAIKLHADAGGNQTIVVANDEGTSESAINLTSSLGGVAIAANAGKDITLDGGQVVTTATHNVAAAIKLHADVGSAQTIQIINDAGTVDGTAGDGAIDVEATLGGISLLWNDAKDLWAEGGQIMMVANHDAANAIKLHADAGTSQTITVVNDAGTSVTEGSAAVQLLSTAGGVGIRSTANLVNAINITADGGTTTTMSLLNDTGTSPNSIGLYSDAGGITLSAPSVSKVHDFNTVAPFSGSASAPFGTDGMYSGTVIKYSPGGDESLTLGGLYFLNTDGTWNATDSNAVGTGATQMLGIGLANARSAGVFIKGFIRIPSTEILNVPTAQASNGKPLYVGQEASHLDFAPPSGSSDFVRIAGYAIEDSGGDVLIYFDPDKTSVVIA